MLKQISIKFIIALLFLANSPILLADTLYKKNQMYNGWILYCLSYNAPGEIKTLAIRKGSGILYPLNSNGRPTENCFTKDTYYAITNYTGNEHSKRTYPTDHSKHNRYISVAFLGGIVLHNNKPLEALVMVGLNDRIIGLKKPAQ